MSKLFNVQDSVTDIFNKVTTSPGVTDENFAFLREVEKATGNSDRLLKPYQAMQDIAKLEDGVFKLGLKMEDLMSEANLQQAFADGNSKIGSKVKSLGKQAQASLEQLPKRVTALTAALQSESTNFTQKLKEEAEKVTTTIETKVTSAKTALGIATTSGNDLLAGSHKITFDAANKKFKVGTTDLLDLNNLEKINGEKVEIDSSLLSAFNKATTTGEEKKDILEAVVKEYQRNAGDRLRDWQHDMKSAFSERVTELKKGLGTAGKFVDEGKGIVVEATGVINKYGKTAASEASKVEGTYHNMEIPEVPKRMGPNYLRGAGIGAALGAAGGYFMTEKPEDKPKNALVFGGIGAGGGALIETFIGNAAKASNTFIEALPRAARTAVQHI